MHSNDSKAWQRVQTGPFSLRRKNFDVAAAAQEVRVANCKRQHAPFTLHTTESWFLAAIRWSRTSSTAVSASRERRAS